MGSTNSARCKGSDAAIKANLANSVAQASIYYDKNKTYAGICTSPEGINSYVLNAVHVLNQNSKVGNNSQAFVYDRSGKNPGSAVCHDGAGAWAMMVSLKNPYASSAGGFCVDSTGTFKEANALYVGMTICPK